jgi:hypothetical protein
MKIHKKLKPFIFTIAGLLPMVIFLSCFIFIPEGADLTTLQGDYYLGKLTINFIELGVFIDVVRLIIRNFIKSKTVK